MAEALQWSYNYYSYHQQHISTSILHTNNIMNLLKFAAFMAAQQANKKDQLSFLRTNIGSGDDAPVACVNEGVSIV